MPFAFFFPARPTRPISPTRPTRPTSPTRPAILALLAPALLLHAVLAGAAQLQHGTIRGVVVGPDGAPVAAATVTLLDGLGDPLAATDTDAQGRFALTNVAPGTYGLRASAPPLSATIAAITVRAALPVEIDVRMSAVTAEQVLVRGDAELEPGSTTTRVTLAGDAVRRAPSRLRSRGLQDAIATTPGWATEDNGLLHVRGVDDGFLYVIDGVPVYERLDGLFGMAPDPAMVDAVTVSTGYIPAEFGFKSGGVIEVRSASRGGDTWLGSVEAAGGNDATRSAAGIAGGPIGSGAALTLGLSNQASSRYLDPVHPDNLHNTGGSSSGGGQFGWMAPDASLLNVVGGFGISDFDVPHGDEQEEAGQDQRQRVRQQWLTASWQRAWSSSSVSQIGMYVRSGSSALAGSANDTPVFTDAHRTLRRTGVLAAMTRQAGRHLLKFGGEAARLSLDERFLFAVTDIEEAEEAELSDAAMAFTPASPFSFRETATPTLFSLYAQDSFRPVDRISVDFGVRADWSRLLTEASQISPRVGVSYRWPATNTTVRGSFGRFYQPPQAENLLLSSSADARELSPFVEETGGGEPLAPERLTAFEGAVEQFLGPNRLDVAVWHRRMVNVADPNVFFGSTIIFPNSVAKGRATGVDVRFEVPRRGGWSGYLSYTGSKVDQFGPINGGLFLEEEIIDIGPGTQFTPDHDQRHVAAAGVSFDDEPGRLSASLSGRYESGTPLEVDDDELDELLERPGSELIDIERGRVTPRTILDATAALRVFTARRTDLTLRVSLLNLTGARWAFNFGNPFSGTHFGPGRTFQVGVRAAFR